MSLQFPNSKIVVARTSIFCPAIRQPFFPSPLGRNTGEVRNSKQPFLLFSSLRNKQDLVTFQQPTTSQIGMATPGARGLPSHYIPGDTSREGESETYFEATVSKFITV
jgi:hypothetical protein